MKNLLLSSFLLISSITFSQGCNVEAKFKSYKESGIWSSNMSWGHAISYIQEDFTEKHQKLNTPFKFTDYYFTKYNFKINDNKYKLHVCKGYYIMNPEDKKLT